ncbi:hypothetical protein F5Y12DRAFT_787983 [Xylaria sp. FL1777]|nr:hypothetical protein F5Y12DRAFT_787983 [Xylaria sp. FL1777]
MDFTDKSRQEAAAPPASRTPPTTTTTTTTLHISDRTALAAAWRSPHAILTHLNADTTWILHLPYPPDAARPAGRSRFNVLLDPWLRGPQSDGGRWLSIQWHVVAPSVQTMAELNGLLGELEKGYIAAAAAAAATDAVETEAAAATAVAETVAETKEEGEEEEEEEESYVDVVAISHEFTDHCHEATLRELPRSTPVFAPAKAAALIRSWRHFDAVTETPPFFAAARTKEKKEKEKEKDWRAVLNCAPLLPPWVGVGRVVTPGNTLYYHSALVVAWAGSASASASVSGEEAEAEAANSVVYSPHGIEPGALSGMEGAGLRTLALLHGLDDVRLWMTKQLNLGGVNGVAAARECGAKYWVATHDEVKKGGGFVSLLLRRTRWSVADAVKREGEKSVVKGAGDDKQVGGYEFVELGSGDGLVLA